MAKKPLKVTCSHCGHTYDPNRYARCEPCGHTNLNIALGRKIGGNVDTAVKSFDTQHGTTVYRDSRRAARLAASKKAR